MTFLIIWLVGLQLTFASALRCCGEASLLHLGYLSVSAFRTAFVTAQVSYTTSVSSFPAEVDSTVLFSLCLNRTCLFL